MADERDPFTFSPEKSGRRIHSSIRFFAQHTADKFTSAATQTASTKELSEMLETRLSSNLFSFQNRACGEESELISGILGRPYFESTEVGAQCYIALVESDPPLYSLAELVARRSIPPLATSNPSPCPHLSPNHALFTTKSGRIMSC